MRPPVPVVVPVVVAVAVAVAALLGSGCAARPLPGVPAVTVAAADLTIGLTLMAPSGGDQRADLTIADAAGRPVEDAEVTAAATMPSMGHAGEVAVAVPVGDGRYRLSGALFPMPGRWELLVRVTRGGTTQEASVPLTVT